MTNSVRKKVEFTLQDCTGNELFVRQIILRDLDIGFDFAIYVRPNEVPEESRIRGVDLPLLHRWEIGKREKCIDGTVKEFRWCTSNIDDAIILLKGWMIVHKNDYYVRNTLAGIAVPRHMPKHESKQNKNTSDKPTDNKQMLNSESLSAADAEGDNHNNKRQKVCKIQQADDGLDVSELERKAQAWRYKHIHKQSLSHYKSPAQVARKKQLEDVITLVSEMAVSYRDKVTNDVFADGATVINQYYTITHSDYWRSIYDGDVTDDSMTSDDFASDMGRILDALDVIIADYGSVSDFKKRRDKLWLQIKCGVDTYVQLSRKIAVRKQIEEIKAEIEEDRARQEEIDRKNAMMWELEATRREAQLAREAAEAAAYDTGELRCQIETMPSPPPPPRKMRTCERLLHERMMQQKMKLQHDL